MLLVLLSQFYVVAFYGPRSPPILSHLYASSHVPVLRSQRNWTNIFSSLNCSLFSFFRVSFERKRKIFPERCAEVELSCNLKKRADLFSLSSIVIFWQKRITLNHITSVLGLKQHFARESSIRWGTTKWSCSFFRVLKIFAKERRKC